MLYARKTDVPIGESSLKCLVVFNVHEGNLETHNKYTWDEPPIYPEMEIVDVFEAESDLKVSIVDNLMDEEMNYLEDKLWAMLEDEKCLRYI